MDFHPLLQALLLGLVEGFTEFLPVSSTGHLILAGDLLHFNDEKGKLFEIVMQSGAILALCWEYRERIVRVVSSLATDRSSQRFTLNIAIAFMPLAVLGLSFGKAIKANLFNPVTVATTFILGGFIILWAERREHRTRVNQVEDLTPVDAFKLGLAQACALVPGTSRSGATIIGGLLFGLSRKAATEFSFFLAIPTLLAATAYQLYKERHLLAFDDLGMWVVGFVASFVSAFFCVRWLLRFIATHDFTIFAWYRIAFGIVVLATWQFGLVELVQPLILYLHGFTSGPQSHKAQALGARMRERGLGDRFICPQLPASPHAAIALAEDLITSHGVNTVVGSSLGGYYSTYLAESFDLKAVLVNPAVVAHLSLKDFVGPQRWLYSGESFEFTLDHIEELRALEIPVLGKPQRFWLLVEEGDETLDYRHAVSRYMGARQTVLPGGDHSFTHWSDYLDPIIEFAGLA